MKRRSRLEVNIDVLKVIQEGVSKPTRIMYMANLSWTLTQETLNDMTQQKLINEIDVSEVGDKRTNKIYEITSKGEKLLELINNANQLIDIDTPLFNSLLTSQ
jgi:predicted transcriptional regulator